MAFISSAKSSSGKEDVNAASIPTTSTNVSPASVNIRADITKIDKDDMEEMDIKWNMALLSMRAHKFWKKIGKKISIQGTDALKALMAIDGVGWDWSFMENEEEDHALVADEEAPIEFALMAVLKVSSSASENGESTGGILSKHEIKFMRPADSPIGEPKKLEQFEVPTVRKWVDHGRSWAKNNNTHKSMSPRPAIHKPYRPPMRPVRPNMNVAQPKRTSFHKLAHSYSKRPFQRTSAMRKFPTGNTKFSTDNRIAGNSHNHIDDKGNWDNGCSRHMTGNICYLSDYEPFDGGYVSFGQGGCKITDKGTIKAGKLEFENVYFVKDLKYNLFSMSQICDNKNSVLFTDSECIVLGRDFKLTDDTNVLLRTPRQHNMYSIDLNNIVLHKDLTCLVAKASADECMLWHRRLGHLNFKTVSKLVRHNLVRGLPTKCFENDHNCTACLKGKQYKASCKTKLVNSVTKPLHTLHMDLFSPTSVSSLNHKWYCLVVTDDFSRFTWTFFLKTKDETSGILRNFITEIENLKELRNRLVERRNKTLIEAARTMLADAKLPVTFWAKVGFLKPFGCHVMILTTLDNLGKFEAKGDKGTKEAAGQDVKKNLSSLRYIVLPNWFHETHLESSTSNAQDACNVDDPGSSGNSNPIATSTNLPADHMETLIPTEEGIDYDEVFAPVARIEAIRLFLAYASFMRFIAYQMDVKSAFFYGTIDEEVYVMQPLGFQDLEFPARVYKVEKAMYGLHQAPRAWYVKRIFRYLKGYPKLGLLYPKESPFDLVAYSDSDYGGASQDRKSITRECQFFGRRLISWQCKKQTIVATSTTEAEYVAAASSCG
uniref:Putative ribonuclease H-like domain-containing protein n=1 Tax=Tanacetum cinerariifolium TaxID=118510 RepID=A0A6L2L0B5_TANCI|nr:putative ribonuclease H-like domain-containing protein [Tanacetum cinerariifolium]